MNQVAGSDGGLEAQRQAIAAACRRHGWQPLERPKQALARLAHPDADALLAAKQARLPELLLDLAALLAAAQTQGWALVALDSAAAERQPRARTRAWSPPSPPSSGA